MAECAAAEAVAPRVSVLLPVYNTKEAFLREAIDSILAQTFTDFELLVVDDASPDPNVRRVVRAYADSRIRYDVNPVNMGISGVRNRLLDMARGEYLAVMDHDDISLPQRFEKEVAYLDANPGVGVVSCFAEVVGGGKTSVWTFPVEDADIKAALIRICPLLHPASMIRRQVLRDSGLRYEADFSPAEDYALWCRLIPHTRFHNLPEVLFRYRLHETNTSIVQKEKMERAQLAVQCMVKAGNPALYDFYTESATHVTRVKLFGFIPCLKIVRRGRRRACSLFGIPLYRSKIDHRLPDGK